MARVATLLPLPGFVYSVSMSLLMLFRIGGSIIAILFPDDPSANSAYTNASPHRHRISPPVSLSFTHSFALVESLGRTILLWTELSFSVRRRRIHWFWVILVFLEEFLVIRRALFLGCFAFYEFFFFFFFLEVGCQKI